MINNLISLLRVNPTKGLKFLIKIVLVGIGLGVISGSLLSIVPKFKDNKRIKISLSVNKESNIPKKRYKFTNNKNNYIQTKELNQLSKKWNYLAKDSSNNQASAYLIFEDGRYASYNSDNSLPAASTIKIAILYVVLEKLDQGELLWDEMLTLDKSSIAGGAGWMRYQKPGKLFPVHEVATEMIRISDNTATNLLIKRIGGLETLNKRLKGLGLLNTELKNFLPDLQGTNTTTAKDLTKLIQLVETNYSLSSKSRDIFREIMSTSITNTLIPDGLLIGLGINPGNSDYKLLIQGFKVYNKTGDIGITYADAALLQMPNTSRAVLALIVKGPFNDPQSTKLMRDMTSEIIPYLNSMP